MTTNFSKGLSVYGVPILPNTGGGGVTTGNVFFVNSGDVNGADDIGTKGKTKDSPFVTWNYAKNQATANNGDVIYAMPGHVETINSTVAFNANVAGLTTIGIGLGENRPRFNLSTSGSNKARIGITAANQRFSNLIFRATSTAVGSSSVGIYINANDIQFDSCTFDHNSTLSFFANTVEVATGVDRYKIIGNEFYNRGTTAQSVKAIDLRSTSSTQSWGKIAGNEFIGSWSRAVIFGSSESTFNNLRIQDNYIIENSTVGGGTVCAIDIDSTKTTGKKSGYIFRNVVASASTGTAANAGYQFGTFRVADNVYNRSSTSGGLSSAAGIRSS